MTDLKQKILEKIHNCNDKIAVGEICEMFSSVWDTIEHDLPIVDKIKTQIDEKDWVSFANSLFFTLIGTLYINCDIPLIEKQQRFQEFYEHMGIDDDEFLIPKEIC